MNGGAGQREKLICIYVPIQPVAWLNCVTLFAHTHDDDGVRHVVPEPCVSIDSASSSSFRCITCHGSGTVNVMCACFFSFSFT